MLRGMIVVYEGAPMVVARLRTIPTYPWEKNSVEYSLAPYGTGEETVPYSYVKDPTAAQVPLLRACDECERPAGFPCIDACSVGTMGRVPASNYRRNREIWDGLTQDQRFILARLVSSPRAEQWGNDLEVLRGLVAMGLVDKVGDLHVITGRGQEINEAGR